MEKNNEGKGSPRRRNKGDGTKQRAKFEVGDRRKDNGKDADKMREMGKRAAAKSKERSLSQMQQDFVANYVITWNASAAAKAAGYSDPGKVGCQLLKDERIQELLSEWRAEIKNDHRKTHEALTEFYLRVLQADTSKIVDRVAQSIADQDPSIREPGDGVLIESITIGKSLTVKVFSKQAAADMLNKHVGYYEVDNKQKAPSGVSIYLPDNGRGDTAQDG